MKIGIVVFGNLTYTPYLQYYTDYLDNNGIQYEIIWWRRRDIPEKPSVKSFVFDERMNDGEWKAKKIFPMLRFRKFALNTIVTQKYDFLILLNSLISVLLSAFLLKHYRNRYVVDIRDLSNEKNSLYKIVLGKVIKNSFFTALSSPAFQNKLPKANYVTCHNSHIFGKGNREIRRARTRLAEPINVAYIGAIGYFKEVTAFLNLIANDKRFLFSFYGSGISENQIQEYCAKNKIQNVDFHGIFKPCEKEGLYSKADIVFNAYGNDNIVVKYALSNKLYESAWYYLPMLVSPETEMANWAESIAFAVDLNDKMLPDKINEWYRNIDWTSFEESCNDLIRKVENENQDFEQCLDRMKNIHF